AKNERPLRTYGGDSNSLVIPLHTASSSGYEWTDAFGQQSLGRIDCSPSLCFNPSINLNQKWIAFQRHSTSAKKFEIALFEKGDEFDLKEHFLPFEGEAVDAQFLDEKRLAWVETDKRGVHFVVFDLEEKAPSQRIILSDLQVN